MKLTPEELSANDYILLDKMDHAELIPFVKTYLPKGPISCTIYYGSIVISLSLFLFFFMKFYRSGTLAIGSGVMHIYLGIALAFALIPLHEFIHALAYKLQGAKQTSYDVNLKKFYFLAMADKFLANKQEFTIVALAPFVSITLALTTIAFYSGQLWTITLLIALLTHAIFCSGDFALLSYFEFNKDKEIVTYDDKENKVSFFFGKEKQKYKSAQQPDLRQRS